MIHREIHADCDAHMVIEMDDRCQGAAQPARLRIGYKRMIHEIMDIFDMTGFISFLTIE